MAGQVVLKAKPHMLWEASYSLAICSNVVYGSLHVTARPCFQEDCTSTETS